MRYAAGTGLVVFVLLVVATAFAAVALVRAHDDLERARSLVERDLADHHTLLSHAGRLQDEADTRVLTADAQAAQGQLSSWGIVVVGHLPFLDTQRAALSQLVSDVATTGTVADQLITRIDALDAMSSATHIALPALASLQTTIASTSKTFKDMDRSAGGLIGVIGSARTSFDHDDATLVHDLERANETLTFLRSFLGADGAQTYLLAGENNAEMRDQGIVLSVAQLGLANGTATIGPSEAIDNPAIQPTHPVEVALPAGTQAVFGYLNPTLLWQQVNATADFALSGRLMQAMYQQTTGAQVDGVIALDVPALASLLKVTGPVLVPGLTVPVTAGNVDVLLLHQLYVNLPDNNQAIRTDDIAATASAIFERMQSEHLDLGQLGDALASDVAGRHLMLWSADPGNQKLLQQLGLDGAVDSMDPNRTYHLAVENSTATKLDYYVVSDLHANVTIERNGSAFVATTVTVDNTAPSGQAPSYQLGPDNYNSHVEGQYVARIDLWSPRDSLVAGSVSESGLRLYQGDLSVLAGHRGTLTFDAIIPKAVVNGRFLLRFVPQPRLDPGTVSVAIHAPGWAIGGSRTVSDPWDQTVVWSWNLRQN